MTPLLLERKKIAGTPSLAAGAVESAPCFPINSNREKVFVDIVVLYCDNIVGMKQIRSVGRQFSVCNICNKSAVKSQRCGQPQKSTDSANDS